MAKKSDLVSYSKQRDATGNQDKWARIKNWKDPMGGASKPLMGNTPLKNSAVNKGKALKPARGRGVDGVFGDSDYTYDGLNKPGDSEA